MNIKAEQKRSGRKLPLLNSLLSMVAVSGLIGCGGFDLRKSGRTIFKGAQDASDDARADRGKKEVDPNADEFEGKGKTLEELEDDGLGEADNLTLIDTGIGFRNFDQINATYSALTGVPTDNNVVAEAFASIKSTLPADNKLASITPGQVSGYTKLAAFYCDVATADAGLRAQIYGDFDFTQSPQQLGQNPDAVIASIVDRFYRPGFSASTDATPDLEMLRQLAAEISVGKDNTQNVVMGLCTAVLSSAGVTVY